MGVLSRYRADRLIQRLLAEDSVNTPAANEIVARLRRNPAAAVEILLERLAQASDKGMRNVAVTLYKLLDDDTLEHYFAGLRSNDTRVLTGLTKVLGSSHRYSPNRLVPLFADPDVSKSVLIEILSQHQDRLNADLLLYYVTELDPADHNAVFAVIERIATPNLVPRLISRLDADSASVRAHVVRVLAQFPSRETSEALTERLQDESRLVRLAAIEGLADADLKPSIAALAPLLRDPDLAIQSHAIDAIIQLRHPETKTYLLPAMQDESEYVRRAAVEVLNGIADTSLISDLLSVLGDEDWWVRERAADALARIGGPRVVDAMLELIKSDDELVRRTVVEVINASHDPRAYDHLIAALGDEDWWVKERAIDALAALGAESAVPDLLRVLDEDPRARPTVLRALATLGDSSVLPRVEAYLDDDNAQVRMEALRALETLTEADHAQSVIAHIESAMGNAADEFREQAREIVYNIRARCMPDQVEEQQEAQGQEMAATGTATMVARPGQGPERLPPGQRLNLAGLQRDTVLDGRYRFIDRVGHGAFGTVMRFEDSTVGEEIILKFLNEHVADDERIAKRFVQELRYARRVTHPNVIRIYDFLLIGGLYAISMEYFGGFPLMRELLDGRPMRTDRALRLLREITYGMAAAHRSGVVHRDLKPANILMSHIGEVKIVDFGIAAAAFREADDVEVTQTGDFVGTPAYTSPEQVRGLPVDARTDIYSLGVVMYRMFGGRLPYRDKQRRELLRRHLEGKPPPLQELNPRLPEGLADVVGRAMAVDPEQRYASMNDLRESLEEFIR